MGIDVVVFVVHGQSSCFDDCITPYVDSFILNGHRPEILVLDSTDVAVESNASKDSLSRVCRKYKLNGAFASGREHKRYLRKVDCQNLGYAIGNGSPKVGGLVNMGLLATSSRSALFIDSDTRFEMASSMLITESDPKPPIVRKFDLIGKMSTGGVSRTGTWGVSPSSGNGCFYKSRRCNIPPFIPSHGWGQGVPWFLMRTCDPNSLPLDIPLSVHGMGPVGSLDSLHTPILDLIHGLVGQGSLGAAGDKLLSHLSELEFSEELTKYASLLSSWDECVDHARSLSEQGVKIAYKP